MSSFRNVIAVGCLVEMLTQDVRICNHPNNVTIPIITSLSSFLNRFTQNILANNMDVFAKYLEGNLSWHTAVLPSVN